MIAIAVGIYLVVGVFLATLGPGRKGIAATVGKIRGSPIAPAIVGEPLPPWKLILFRVLLTGGFILFWPFLIRGVLQEDKPAVPADPDEWFPGNERLWWEGNPRTREPPREQRHQLLDIEVEWRT